jgi:hypothetical protein
LEDVALARELFGLEIFGEAPSDATDAAVAEAETAIVEEAVPITEGLGVNDAVDELMFILLKLLAKPLVWEGPGLLSGVDRFVER